MAGIALALAFAPAGADEVVVSTGEYAPWTGENLPGGGFVNRVVREAFRREGITVKFKYRPWTRALAELRDGTVQGSSYWGRDPARDKDFLPSDVLVEHRELLFHRKDKILPKWRRLADLSGFRFGATRSYTYTPEFWALTRQGVLNVTVSQDDESSLRKLLGGSVDILPMDEFSGWSILSSGAFPPGSRDLVVAEPMPFSVISGHLMLRKTPEGERLLKRFNHGLASMKTDGTLEAYREDMFRGSGASR
ncbi:substrate-binding periplasmic protein [Paludibacterium paludis]|uniref:substrate-binding periplasmic protein n=1 Tax=Paludibacterium paludis TaxID=1225769 RepID=UPI00167673BD|nr:transporter substrate-binding domain-containing protein [Paludibacterium paludis]